MNLRNEVCSGSCPTSIEDFRTSESILGNNLPRFETFDVKIANWLKKLVAANYCGKNELIEEQKAHNENRFIRGRLIAVMIYDFLRITGTGDSIWDFSDLMGA